MRDRAFASRLGGLCHRFLIGLAGFTLLLFSGCEQPVVPPAPGKPGIAVVVRPGPATWFIGPNGEATGFDHDLLTRFARERGVPLNVSFAEGAAALLKKIGSGEAQLGAGGLFQTASAQGNEDVDAGPALAWSTGYQAVEPVLIYNVDGYRPRRWDDLDKATVAYPAHTGMDAQLAAVRRSHPEVHWEPVDVVSADSLIAQVADGTTSYAVVASSDAAVARNIYLDFDVAFPAGPRREFAWAVAPGYPELRHALDAFFARLRKDGTLARLADRYFADTRQVERIDAGVFHDRIRKALPEWRKTFIEAQAKSGVEWRLLAAIAYQESQWDPGATSETGVRGLMQLTEDTARSLGVADRLDPKSAAIGAARYLADLEHKLPARIAEPDRTWLALAAFNIGIGHLEDARVLAQRQKLNPDLWSDVRKVLPLLAEPEYYIALKNGYARGGMPVAFVGRVRGYYDILLRTESAGAPRLQANLALR
ncbi:MAG: membrane-bound lytic murein transglycosylase MltF [Casimicrobiaceae bacterium]